MIYFLIGTTQLWKVFHWPHISESINSGQKYLVQQTGLLLMFKEMPVSAERTRQSDRVRKTERGRGRERRGEGERAGERGAERNRETENRGREKSTQKKAGEVS